MFSVTIHLKSGKEAQNYSKKLPHFKMVCRILALNPTLSNLTWHSSKCDMKQKIPSFFSCDVFFYFFHNHFLDRKKYLWLSLLWMLCVPNVIFAQTRTVVTIVSAQQKPIQGAVLGISTMQVVAVSDADGRITLEALPQGFHAYALQAEGFQTQRGILHIATNQTAFQIAMTEDHLLLYAEKVTGFAQNREQILSETSSTRLNAEVLTNFVPQTELKTLLMGKAIGLDVQPTSGALGTVSHFQMRDGGTLRGNGEPLIYVDGVLLTNEALYPFGNTSVQPQSMLSDLAPSEIATIDVLKGASATALFGGNAANGVILITTKRGNKAQDALMVNYRYTKGQNRLAMPFNATNAALPNRANALFQGGNATAHSFEVSGRANGMRYFSSLAYQDVQGATLQDAMKRYNYQLNLDVYPHRRVLLSVSSHLSRNAMQLPFLDGNALSYIGQFSRNFAPFAELDSAAIANASWKMLRNRFIGGIQARYEMLKGLQIEARVGYDAGFSQENEFLSRNQVYPNVASGRRTESDRKSVQTTYQLNASYSFRPAYFMQSTTFLGLEALEQDHKLLQIQKEGFQNDLSTSIGLGNIFLPNGNFENAFQARQMGILARQSFRFGNDVEYATLNLGARYDTATSIGNEAKPAIYPQISGAFRLDPYLPESLGMNLLKLRASYGQAGFLPSENDESVRLWRSFAGANGNGVLPFAIGSPDIQPEKISELEFGSDLALANAFSLELTYFRRTVLNAILYAPQPPSTGFSFRPISAGASKTNGIEANLQFIPFKNEQNELKMWLHYGAYRQEITDLANLSTIFDARQLNALKAGLPRNAFYSDVVVGVEYDTNGKYLRPLMSSSVIAENNAFFLKNVDGSKGAALVVNGASGKTISTQGATNYATGKIDLSGRQFLGSPDPKQTFGASLQGILGRYFTFYAAADAQLGRVLENADAAARIANGGSALYNTYHTQLGLPCSVIKGVSNPCTPNILPLAVGTTEYKETAAKYALLDPNIPAHSLQKADFLRIRELSLQYDLGKFFYERNARGQIRSLQLGIAAQNLWLWTNFGGNDPETRRADSWLSAAHGYQSATIPLPKTILISIKMGM